MALSKREKTIGLVAGLVLGALALDSFVVRPFFDSMDQLEQEQEMLRGRLADAKQTIAASDMARRRWGEFRAGSLETDASSTENNLLNALRGWSQDSRLTLTSIRPDRTTGNHGLQEKNFQASVQGPMSAVSAFLYRVETSHLPVRIREMQITSRSEGTDDLAVQIRLSTIWEDTNVRSASAARSQP